MKKDWDNIYREHGKVQKGVWPFLSRNLSSLKKGGKVLDLGCGTGRHLLYLAKRGYLVTGTDISVSGLDLADAHLRKNGINGVTLIHGDMRKLPFADKTFDSVVSCWTLHHSILKDFGKTLREINRVLKNRGILMANVQSTSHFWYGEREELEPNTFRGEGEEYDVPHHYFSMEELAGGLEKAGFSIEKMRHTKRMTNTSKATDLKIIKRNGIMAHWEFIAVKK